MGQTAKNSRYSGQTVDSVGIQWPNSGLSGDTVGNHCRHHPRTRTTGTHHGTHHPGHPYHRVPHHHATPPRYTGSTADKDHLDTTARWEMSEIPKLVPKGCLRKRVSGVSRASPRHAGLTGSVQPGMTPLLRDVVLPEMTLFDQK